MTIKTVLNDGRVPVKIWTDEIEPQAKEQLKNIELDFIQAENKSIGAIIKANGIIDVPPESMLSISATMGGYVKYTKLLPGMKISKGQVLAILEGQQFIELSKNYLTTKNKFELSKIDFEKQQELYKAKAISEKAYLS